MSDEAPEGCVFVLVVCVLMLYEVPGSISGSDKVPADCILISGEVPGSTSFVN